MEILWKKDAAGALFVDIFKSMDIDCLEEFSEMHEHIDTAKRLEDVDFQLYRKDDSLSANYRMPCMLTTNFKKETGSGPCICTTKAYALLKSVRKT